MKWGGEPLFGFCSILAHFKLTVFAPPCLPPASAAANACRQATYSFRYRIATATVNMATPTLTLKERLDATKAKIPVETFQMFKKLITLTDKVADALENAGSIPKGDLAPTNAGRATVLTEGEQKKVDACKTANDELCAAFKALGAAQSTMMRAIKRSLGAAPKCVSAIATARNRTDKAKAKAKADADKAKAKAGADKPKAKAGADKPKAKPKAKAKAGADKPKSKPKTGAGGKRGRADAAASAAALGMPSPRAKVMWNVTIAHSEDTVPTDGPVALVHTGAASVSPALIAIAGQADVFSTDHATTRKQFEAMLGDLMGAFRVDAEDRVVAVDSIAWSSADVPVEGDFVAVTSVKDAFPRLCT